MLINANNARTNAIEENFGSSVHLDLSIYLVGKCLTMFISDLIRIFDKFKTGKKLWQVEKRNRRCGIGGCFQTRMGE